MRFGGSSARCSIDGEVMLTLHNLSLCIEVPVSTRKAWARDLPPLCSAMSAVVMSKGHEQHAVKALLCNVIEAWRTPGETLFGISFNLFCSRETLALRFSEAHMEANLLSVPGAECLFRSEDDAHTRFALDAVDAEAVHMFFSRNVDDALCTVREAEEHKGSYTIPEAPYLKRLHVHGGIITYDGASDLSVLGTPRFVVERCRRLASRMWDPVSGSTLIT